MSDPHRFIASSQPVAQEAMPQWLRRWLDGEQIGCSTGIDGDDPTYGYDGPDGLGYFDVPVPERFMERLVEHAKAYAERNGLKPQRVAQEGEALRERIAKLAIEYHKSQEGEYGCNGLTCPGVQRLIVFANAAIHEALAGPRRAGEDQ